MKRTKKRLLGSINLVRLLFLEVSRNSSCVGNEKGKIRPQNTTLVIGKGSCTKNGRLVSTLGTSGWFHRTIVWQGKSAGPVLSAIYSAHWIGLLRHLLRRWKKQGWFVTFLVAVLLPTASPATLPILTLRNLRTETFRGIISCQWVVTLKGAILMRSAVGSCTWPTTM